VAEGGGGGVGEHRGVAAELGDVATAPDGDRRLTCVQKLGVPLQVGK
jgi:hypothetical protein